MGLKITIRDADFSIGGLQSHKRYVDALSVYYTPTATELKAIKRLFGILSPYMSKFKLLYLFVGDNENAHRINAANTGTHDLLFLAGAETEKTGLKVGANTIVSTQYIFQPEDFNNLTFFGLANVYNAAGTFIGQRKNGNSNRVSLRASMTLYTPVLYCIPNSGAWNVDWAKADSYMANTTKWVAGSMNETTATIYSSNAPTEGYKGTRDITGKMFYSNNVPLTIGCESESGATPISGTTFNTGTYLHTVAFAEYLEESDITIIAEAFYQFNQAIR